MRTIRDAPNKKIPFASGATASLDVSTKIWEDTFHGLPIFQNIPERSS